MDRIGVSIVSWIDVLAGAGPEEEPRIRDVLAQFELFFVDFPIADIAASLRRSTRLKLPDAVILATANVDG